MREHNDTTNCTVADFQVLKGYMRSSDLKKMQILFFYFVIFLKLIVFNLSC